MQDSDKGGARGQWSARKAQMMAAEYKKRGGGYTDDASNKDESQKNVSQWGDEQWQTKDGSANAKNDDGSRRRYLAKKAWENMSEEEKNEGRQGKQFVADTHKAKQSRKKATQGKNGDEEEAQVGDKHGKGTKHKQKTGKSK